MAAFRDSRFGQFADPSFGASLSSAQPAQGVLPAPADVSTSASSFPNGGAGGAMAQPSGSNSPGSIYLAEGGQVPGDDDDQDSGDAQPSNTDPFSFITQALSQGRKKFGLPSSFFGDSTGPASPDGGTQSFAEGGPVEDDGDEDDGVIPSGNTDQEDQGDQGQMTPSGNAQPNPQGAMAYLKGAGAVGPEIAAALEQRVDPQGQMPPAQRKLMAVANAGDPDRAFGVMQHYRQKFNAYGAFAKAALQGAGGRPPNPAAAADALNKAYDHVPDGKQLQFTPVQGGMRVSVQGGQQQSQQQSPEQEPQKFAEGGAVEDEPDVDYETAGAQPWAGDPHSRDLQAAAAQDDSADDWETRKQKRIASMKGVMGKVEDALSPTEGEREGYNALGSAISSGASAVARGAKSLWDQQDMRSIQRPLNFIMSIPQLLGWQSKDGQFDSVMDKGAEQTLSNAAKNQTPPGITTPQAQFPDAMAPGAPGTFAAPAQQQQPQQAQALSPSTPQAQFPPAPSPVRQTPRNAEAFGAQVGTKSSQDGLSLADMYHEIDQAYPMVGMAQQRALARAAALQHWADNHTKIEQEQTKGANLDNRARIQGGFKLQDTDLRVKGKHEDVQTQQEHGDTRAATKFKTAKEIADENRRSRESEGDKNRTVRTDNAIIGAKPGVLGSREKMDQARTSLAPGLRPQPQQPQQAQQPQQPQQPAGRDGQKLVNGKWYKRGPNGEAVLVP